MPSSSGYTIEEIVDIIAKRFGNESSDFSTYLTTQVNIAQQDISILNDWRHLHDSSTMSYTADVQYATLPSDCRSIEDIYDATNGRKLKKCQLRDIRRVNPKNDKTGEPTHYADWSDTKLYLYPTPEENGTLDIDYLRNPAWINAGGYPDMPVRLQPLLIQKTYCDALQRQNDDRYTTELQVLQQMVANAIRGENAGLENNDRIRWQEEEESLDAVDNLNRRLWA